MLLCLGLVAVGRGHLIPESGWQAGVLTPQVRQIWLAVKERTPPDALIFTDQTGIEPTLLGSWNTYAFIGATADIRLQSLYEFRDATQSRSVRSRCCARMTRS